MSTSKFMSMTQTQIAEAVSKGELCIAIVGCGWMGLPTSLLFAEAGARVIGVVKSESEFSLLNSGIPNIAEPGVDHLLRKHVEEGRFKVVLETSKAASEADVILIIVPTSVGRGKKPEYSAVLEAAREVGKGLRKGSLVILCSTLGPGVTEELVKPELESSSGLKVGQDLGLAYSPIRASAGSVLRDLTHYARVVAGVDEKSLELASSILSLIVKGVIVKVRNIKTAEAVKLFENIYRDVNIALVNQLAMYCEREGIDIAEVINAANTQPYCHLHKPGIGVGGHCLPSNPYFLLDRARKFKLNLNLVRLGRKINDGMLMHTIRLATSALRSCGKTLKGSSIAILGASFKEGVKDYRYSPSIQIAEGLLKRGVNVSIYDPYFTPEELKIIGARVAPTLQSCIEGVDCILVAVAHEAFKSIDLKELARLVRMPAVLVDGRQIVEPSKAIEAGFIYAGVGRGLIFA